METIEAINVFTAGHRQRRSLGQSCDDSDDHRYAYFIDEQLVPEKYLYCDKRTKQFESATCPIANGHQRVFDEITEQCLQPQSRNRRHIVGMSWVSVSRRMYINCIVICIYLSQIKMHH